MALSLFNAPTVPPITVAEAKDHLRITFNEHDELVRGLIDAARFRAEAITGRQFMQATWDLGLDAFPCEYEIRIPKAPLISVTSVSYIDTAGVTQVWGASNYQVDAPTGPMATRGRLQPSYATNWPSARTDTMNAVVIRFVAGYGTKPTDVPEDIRLAMKLLIAAAYYDSDATAALSLLTPYKLYA